MTGWLAGWYPISLARSKSLPLALGDGVAAVALRDGTAAAHGDDDADDGLLCRCL